MNNKEIIIITFILIISIVLSYIFVEKYDFKMRMLPICAWQWFYVYYDNQEWKCKCYNWYKRIEWKIWCFKNK
jgi:hypothetical protein